MLPQLMRFLGPIMGISTSTKISGRLRVIGRGVGVSGLMQRVSRQRNSGWRTLQ